MDTNDKSTKLYNKLYTIELQQRLWELAKVAMKPGSQLDKNTTVGNLMRAVDGDLKQIGDALIDGKRILMAGSDIFNINLSSSAKYYSVEGE